MLYIASDHGGWDMKESIKKFLQKGGIDFFDCGPGIVKKDDDYPDFAFHLGKKVGKKSGELGILLCRSGGGMTIAANKVKGARATQVYSTLTARASRRDDYANIMVLAADEISQKKACQLIMTWLKTPPGKQKRFHRRLKKIEAFEKKYLCS